MKRHIVSNKSVVASAKTDKKIQGKRLMSELRRIEAFLSDMDEDLFDEFDLSDLLDEVQGALIFVSTEVER